MKEFRRSCRQEKKVTYRCEKVDKSLRWVVIERQSAKQSSVSTESVIGEVIAAVNRERAAAGLNSVTECRALDQSALAQSRDTYTRDFFDHVNPDGKSPTDRIRATGYLNNAKRWSMGENIAKGFSDVASVMKAWMNSPDAGFIWTQNFGSGGTC